MSRRFFMPAAVVLAAAACHSSLSVPLSVSMPAVTPFPAGLIGEIVVTDFRTDAATGGFDLAHELQSYFVSELGRAFKGPVSAMAMPSADPLPLDDPAFWKEAAGKHERKFFLTGSAGLAAQVRKALLKGGLPADGPFRTEGRGLVEQRHYVLTVEISVVSAATGEPSYQKFFREEKDYAALDTPPEFAFAELADRVRARLFSVLLGTATVEERALLRR